MIELYCEYLPVQSFWLYVIILSRTRLKLNLHYIIPRVSRKSFLETGVISGV